MSTTAGAGPSRRVRLTVGATVVLLPAMPSNKVRGFTLKDSELWRRREFKNLSDKGKLLVLYLRCCPHANNTGLFHLPAEYINGDLGWTPVEIAAVLREITDPCQFCLYDPKTEFVWLPNRLKEFGIQNSNQAKNALTLLKGVPDNFHFIAHYAKALLVAYRWQGEGLKYIREKGGLSAQEVGVYPSAKGELLEGDVYTRFHQFWHAFGLYEQKNRAADGWLAVEPAFEKDGALLDVILYAAGEEAKLRKLEGHDPKKAMKSHVWLNNRRWEKWLDRRNQAAVPSAPVVDWESVAETFAINWEMGESFEDFKQRIITAWRESQQQARQENEKANAWKTQSTGS